MVIPYGSPTGYRHGNRLLGWKTAVFLPGLPCDRNAARGVRASDFRRGDVRHGRRGKNPMRSSVSGMDAAHLTARPQASVAANQLTRGGNPPTP